jgi:hypothetical protein
LARGNGELPLHKPVKSAILTAKPPRSGECRFRTGETTMADDISTLNSMLVKLQQVVTGNMSPAGLQQPSNTFVSFCMPGIAISQDDVDFGYVAPTGDQREAMADFSALVNSTPPIKGRFAPGAVKLNEAYAMMLRDSVLPQVVFSPKEEADLETARKLLWRDAHAIDDDGGVKDIIGDTTLFEAYNERRQAYTEALIAYNTAAADALYSTDPKVQAKWAMLGPALANRKDTAYNRLMVVAGPVEKAVGVLATIAGRGPEVYWRIVRQKLDESQLATTGGTFLPTKYFPNKFWDAAHAGGWTEFNFSHEEEH